MEILSTGEKIKRARIYKGITLKELCDDRISISKMSCIENGKVKPENWILEIVAEKLEIEFGYLVQDVRYQLEENLKNINKKKHDKDFEKRLQINLNYAMEYKYFDLAFELMKKLFEYYLYNGDNNKIQGIITQYYELSQKNGSSVIVFYKDVATYFFNNKEYIEALTCYSKLRDEVGGSDENFKGELLFLETSCYIEMSDCKSALVRLEASRSLIDNLSDNLIKGKLIGIYNSLKIEMNENTSDDEILNGFKLLEANKKELASMKIIYGKSLFCSGNYGKAKEEIQYGLSIYPKDDKEQYNAVLNNVISIFIKYDQLDEAERLSEESLNIAINCNNNRLIEESYYLKAIVFQKLGNFIQAEMYMNLSLDSLIKFGTNEQRYSRYIEMGNMYHELGEIRESIKYFTLAINIEKKF